MVEEAFLQVYTKFKLHFYKALFEKIQKRETSLTTVETYCIEIIDALGNPTIGEFASFIQISSPNAARQPAGISSRTENSKSVECVPDRLCWGSRKGYRSINFLFSVFLSTAIPPYNTSWARRTPRRIPSMKPAFSWSRQRVQTG